MLIFLSFPYMANNNNLIIHLYLHDIYFIEPKCIFLISELFLLREFYLVKILQMYMIEDIIKWENPGFNVVIDTKNNDSLALYILPCWWEVRCLPDSYSMVGDMFFCFVLFYLLEAFNLMSSNDLSWGMTEKENITKKMPSLNLSPFIPLAHFSSGPPFSHIFQEIITFSLPRAVKWL